MSETSKVSKKTSIFLDFLLNLPWTSYRSLKSGLGIRPGPIFSPSNRNSPIRTEPDRVEKKESDSDPIGIGLVRCSPISLKIFFNFLNFKTWFPRPRFDRIGLARETESNDSQPDPDRPDNLELTPGMPTLLEIILILYLKIISYFFVSKFSNNQCEDFS